MNVEIRIDQTRWNSHGDVSYIGYIFYKNQLINVMDLENELLSFISGEKFDNFFSIFNGQFTIILKTYEAIYLITSPGAFYLVHYTKTQNELLVSDRIESFKDYPLDKDSLDSLKYCGFVPFSKTVYENVYSCQSGTIHIITEQQISTIKPFQFAVSNRELFNPNTDIGAKANEVILNAFKRTVKVLNGRKAVVPLSAGYDSRLILAALKKLNHNNILAFTYGRPGNIEARTAQKVASELNIEWYNIEYTPELINSLFDKTLLYDYIQFAFNGKSSICLHEFYAVLYLRSKGLISDGSVFIPGHSGDVLGGSQLIKVFPINYPFSKISKLYVKSKFNLFTKQKQTLKAFETIIINEINKHYNQDQLSFSILEDIDLNERLSKFILNAAQVFRFFNYTVLTPFWDSELLDLFKRVPTNQRVEKRLYDQVLENNFFKPLHISFLTEENPSLMDIYFSRFKKPFKRLLPKTFKQKLLIKNDITNYEKITQPLKQDLENAKIKYYFSHTNYNEIISQWIINKVLNKL
ncbi:MAG: asparagine synthase [Marinilabiliaceae bacterium]|nr:asparagine synthase [Marinilabiliaceae bacterium]